MNYNEIVNKMALHRRFTSEQSLPFKVNDYICWFDYQFEILEDYLCDVYVDNVYLLKNDDVTIKEVELVYRHKIVDEYIKSEEDFYLFLYNELNNTKNNAYIILLITDHTINILLLCNLSFNFDIFLKKLEKITK